MIIEKRYSSNLINFEKLEPGDCFKSTDVNYFERDCAYYIKLKGSVKENKIVYNAVRLDDGAFWFFELKDKVYKTKAKIVIED